MPPRGEQQTQSKRAQLLDAAERMNLQGAAKRGAALRCSPTLAVPARAVKGGHIRTGQQVWPHADVLEIKLKVNRGRVQTIAIDKPALACLR